MQNKIWLLESISKYFFGKIFQRGLANRISAKSQIYLGCTIMHECQDDTEVEIKISLDYKDKRCIYNTKNRIRLLVAVNGCTKKVFIINDQMIKSEGN